MTNSVENKIDKDDFFEVRIPFDKENPLDLKDLSAYLSRLENFFLAHGVELEIYEARTGSFIPKFRKLGNALITIASVLEPLDGVFEKISNNIPINEYEIRQVQPILAVNSKVNITNINYNGKNYDTSTLGAITLNTDFKEDNTKNIEPLVEKFESQVLVFSKIDTLKNNNCSGIIKSLDENVKKVSFKSLDVKQLFNFSETSEPFKQSYVVDINVYYNPDKSVAKYEIIDLIDNKPRNLFNDKD